MSGAMPDRVLWTAGLLDRSFEERIDAAVQLGYRRMSVSSAEAVEWLEEGPVRLTRARRAAEDAGISLAVLDPVVTWLPTDPRWPLARAGIAEIEEIGRLLGIEALCVIAGRDHGVGRDEMVQRFRGLCDLAARHGWITAVEFAPMSGIRTLGEAVDLVAESRRDNAAVLFDSWHFYRGGGTIEELDAVPAGWIQYVQLSDASTDFAGSLARDTYHRRLPGSGDIDLTVVLRSLAALGALGAAGPEVLRAGQEGRPAPLRVREEAEAVGVVWRSALGYSFLP